MDSPAVPARFFPFVSGPYWTSSYRLAMQPVLVHRAGAGCEMTGCGYADSGRPLNVARRLCTICSLKGSAVCTPTAGSARVLRALGIWALALSGCDPVINIAGADFPSWLVCLIAGAMATAILRPLLVKLRLEPYMGPLLLVYPSLAVLLSCVIYLIFFNRI